MGQDIALGQPDPAHCMQASCESAGSEERKGGKGVHHTRKAGAEAEREDAPDMIGNEQTFRSQTGCRAKKTVSTWLDPMAAGSWTTARGDL